MAINLYVKSDNSFLSSNIKIDDIIKFSIQFNNKEASLIDKNNMFGTYNFYECCKNNNIKPIIGVDFDFKYNDYNFSLVLISKSKLGYSNLVYLTSLKNKDDNPLDITNISLYTQDIICIIKSFDSTLENFINNNDFFGLNNILDITKKVFKEVYFGIYRYHGYNKTLIDSTKDYFLNQNIKSIALNFANHKNNKDTLIISLLDAIKKQEKANKDFLNNPFIVESYLKTSNQLEMFYAKDEIDNLNKLVKSTHLIIDKVDFSLPEVFKDINSDIRLKELALTSLKEKKLDDKIHLDRFEYEYKIITSKGFSNYYLVVADYVNYAKNNNIPVGPSRGSGGASLIAYLLNITSYDPLDYNLLFERFLNEQRSNYPDFDIDFADNLREKVIDYVINKYGYDNVCHITTFSTFKVKSAIRSVGKALKINDSEVEYVLSFISTNPISINDEYKNNQPFKNVCDIHANYKTMITLASQIEGLKKQEGIHAAGIIISKENLNKIIPTYISNNVLVSQYEYDVLEKLNLIKFDFLGLNYLSVINECFNIINNKFNTSYNLLNYDYDNESTYKLISSLNTLDIFQLESAGMNKAIYKLKPSSFNDVVALISLYRPGPMDNIDKYCENKNSNNIEYIDDSLEDILKETHGIIVYQEQIMQILQKLANYTLAEADIVRRAISKKKIDIINKEKSNFLNKAISNNINKEKALKIFDYIAKFAEYGFNKAHAVGYGKITCVMASLKIKYPEIFYYTMLKYKGESGTKLALIVKEAKKFNISFAFSDVNKPELSYTLDNKTIILGLTNIKSIQENIANIIIEEYNKHPYVDIYDFIIRMVLNNVSIKIIESLIYGGALDSFNIERIKLISNLNNLYNYALMFKGTNYIPGEDYSSFIILPSLDNNYLDIDIYKKEYEELGFYISTSPLVNIKNKSKFKGYTLDMYENDTIHDSLVYIKAKKIYNFNTGLYLELLLEDETCTIKARCYKNIDSINSLIELNKLYICNLTCKNSRFFLNNIKEFDYEKDSTN